MRTQGGELLFGTNPSRDVPGMGGVVRYDERRQTLVPRYTVDNGMLPNNSVRDIRELNNGTLYISTRGGVARINPRTGRSDHWGADQPRGLEYDNYVIWKLFLDSRETVWASMFGNLVYFRNGEITPVDFWERDDAPSDPHRFLEDVITTQTNCAVVKRDSCKLGQ